MSARGRDTGKGKGKSTYGSLDDYTDDVVDELLDDTKDDVTDEKTNKDTKSSWIWNWIEARTPPQGGEMRMYCTVKHCRQKEGWTMKGNSRSGPRKHLMFVHKLTENDKNDGTFHTPTGPLQRAFANHGQKQHTPEKWQHAQCQLLVHHKLPYTFFESPYLKNLIFLAHSAPSPDRLVFPSNDSMTSKVCLLYCS